MKNKLFAVFGNPISFSKSPNIFNYLFKKNNIKACYSRVRAVNVQELLYLYNKLKLTGANITSPFKKDIYKNIDFYDKNSLDIETVNTIKKTNGKIKGYNTDINGISKSLKGINLENKNITVLGAGGAAESVLKVISKYQNKIVILNRTLNKAKVLSKKYNCKYDKLEKIRTYIHRTDVLIYGISKKKLPFSKEIFKKVNDLIIFNAHYGKNDLKKAALENNFKYIGGKNWLINQATPVYEIFFDKNYKIDDFITGFETIKNINNNIGFIGFMGAGKSSISKLVAKSQNMKHVEIDNLIEKKENMKINKIFEKKGERYFRKIESRVLENLKDFKNTVFSYGGGILNNDKNKRIISKLSYNIYLWVEFEEILKRINGNERPKFKNKSELKTLKKNRFENYFCCSDLVINTNNKTINKIYKEVNNEINQIL